jgi:hypothetical protein
LTTEQALPTTKQAPATKKVSFWTALFSEGSAGSRSLRSLRGKATRNDAVVVLFLEAAKRR